MLKSREPYEDLSGGLIEKGLIIRIEFYMTNYILQPSLASTCIHIGKSNLEKKAKFIIRITISQCGGEGGGD